MRFVLALKLLFMDVGDTPGKELHFKSNTEEVSKKNFGTAGYVIGSRSNKLPSGTKMFFKLIFFDFSICYPGMLGISYTMEYESFTFK